MFSCPACGSKDGGFFRLCGSCDDEYTLSLNQKTKIPHRPIKNSEDSDE